MIIWSWPWKLLLSSAGLPFHFCRLVLCAIFSLVFFLSHSFPRTGRRPCRITLFYASVISSLYRFIHGLDALSLSIQDRLWSSWAFWSLRGSPPPSLYPVGRLKESSVHRLRRSYLIDCHCIFFHRELFVPLHNNKAYCLRKFHRLKLKTFNDTHVFVYFVSLLVANIFQCVGTVINFEWVARGGVILGLTCGVQGMYQDSLFVISAVAYLPTLGAFKQLGNLGVSAWCRFSLRNCLEFGWDIPLRSLIIAMHVFNVLFLRIPVSKVIHIGAVCSVWSFVFFIVLIGRFATHRPELGPYFGISGAWWGGYPISYNYLISEIVGVGYRLTTPRPEYFWSTSSWAS